MAVVHLPIIMRKYWSVYVHFYTHFSPQTAVVGSRVTLPCRVENKAGQLQWTKDDFGLGLHRELSGYDRYKMIGSDEEGELFRGSFYIGYFSTFFSIKFILVFFNNDCVSISLYQW